MECAPHSVNDADFPDLSANPGGTPGSFLSALNQYGRGTAMIGKLGGDVPVRLPAKTLAKKQKAF